MTLLYYGICASLKIIHMLVMKSLSSTLCCSKVGPDFSQIATHMKLALSHGAYLKRKCCSVDSVLLLVLMQAIYVFHPCCYEFSQKLDKNDQSSKKFG